MVTNVGKHRLESVDFISFQFRRLLLLGTIPHKVEFVTVALLSANIIFT